MSRRAKVVVSALMVMSPLLAGCDFGVNFWQASVVQLDLPAEATKTFSAGQDITLGNSTNLPVGNLAGIQIPEVNLQVNDIGADNKATTLSGSLVITEPSDPSLAPVTLPFESLLVTDGASLTLTPSSSQATELDEMLLSRQSLHIEYSTTVDALPAQFQLTASIHIVAEVAI